MLGWSGVTRGLLASVLAACAVGVTAAPAQATMPGPSKEAVVDLVDAQIPGDLVSSAGTTCSIVALPYVTTVIMAVRGVWYYFVRPFGVTWERYFKALNIGSWRLC